MPLTIRPDGGIGRRVGLKHQWSDPCRFEPGLGHENLPVSNRKVFILQDTYNTPLIHSIIKLTMLNLGHFMI